MKECFFDGINLSFDEVEDIYSVYRPNTMVLWGIFIYMTIIHHDVDNTVQERSWCISQE